MPPVERLPVDAVEPLHTIRQVRLRRLHHEVVVSSHEAISAAVPVKTIDDTGKERQEVLVVVASDEEAVSPGRLPDDVVKTAGDEEARRVSHATNMPGGSESPR